MDKDKMPACLFRRDYMNLKGRGQAVFSKEFRKSLNTKYLSFQYFQFVEYRVNPIMAGTIEFPLPFHAGILGAKL